VGLGLDALALGDEPVGDDVDGVPVVGGGGHGSVAISRPKMGGRFTLRPLPSPAGPALTIRISQPRVTTTP